MGIRCLTKFVNQYFKGWKTAPVNGTLIIDGYALFHALFGKYSIKQRAMYGGDYVSIRREISRFLRILLKAGINPLVVLDGTADDDKIDTINNRAETKIKAIVKALGDHTQPSSTDSQITPNKPQHTTPYLSVDVIVDSVKRVLGDDHLFVADCDADVDIACLAIHHQCPVLSSDSDFYIFPLLYGYIPYSRFHWRNAESNVIYGEFYSYQLFCKQFGICDESLLTIIPVIAGNDTITQLHKKRVNMIMPKDAYTGVLMENAVKYVASFTTFDACLSSLRKHKLFGMIENIQDAYFNYFFLPLFKPRSSSKTVAQCTDGSPLPQFILRKYRKGTLLPFVIDVLWIHGACFSLGIEDILSESWCCLIGVPIRKAIYGILCGSDVCVSENQRCKCATSYEVVEIESTTHVTYDGKQIPLPTLQSCGSKVDVDYGRKILFGILDTRKEDFKSVPKDYKLFLAITRNWYKHCMIKKKHILLSSFILLVQLSKEHKIERNISEYVRTLSKLVLSTQSTLPTPSTQPPFPIASFAHAFAQWQSLYRDIQCLNELLQRPLKLLPVSGFLECSYLYSLVEAVMKGGVSAVIKQHCLNRTTYRLFLAVTSSVGRLPTQVKHNRK